MANTMHLSTHDIGAYCLLIAHAWEHGGYIADDDAVLARIARVHPPHWKRVRRRLEPFFDLTHKPGSWTSKRVSLELAKSDEISNKRRNAALQRHSKSTTNPEHLHTQSQSQSHIDAADDERGDGITDQAMMVAVEIGKACGFRTAEDWPPSWMGAPRRVQTILNAGWRADLMIETARAVMARRGSAGPPNSFAYFEKVFADPHAQQAKPLPTGDANGKTRRQRTVSPITAAIDGLIEKFQREAGAGGEVREDSTRLLPGR